ncbi:MAG TPA: DUF4157 domain-containing protein [Nitrospira sp.]|nr:DUF4157 domain-containing protein [Nitrospira sp.]
MPRFATSQEKVPRPNATCFTEIQGGLLQHKCACGTHTSGGECSECAQKKVSLQRKGNGIFEQTEVPPIVHEVLRSPGQPLDPATRAFFEPRFGHDFSQVRVHIDAKAAESARAVNAVAYTVGEDVVFGAGQYARKSPVGQRLIAHELAHVLQQGSHKTNDLSLAPSNGPSEEEANQAANNVFGGLTEAVRPLTTTNSHGQQLHRQLIAVPGSPVPLAGPYTGYKPFPPPPAPPPWLISGNTATAIGQSASLGALAMQVGAHFNDWKCIKPIAMRALDAATATENQKEHYDRFVERGDKFDFSNLTAQTGPGLNLYLFEDGKSDAEIAKRFYPTSVATDNPDFAIQKASDYGSTPIHDFLLVGHASGGGYMYGISGGGNKFEPSGKSSEEPQVFYDEAKNGHFPRRCRFTRNAVTRLVGCDSEVVGRNFASVYLPSGASVTTTTRSIRTVCRGQPLGTPCEHPNALEFAAGFPPATVGGPFGTVADFETSGFWATLPGHL